MFLLLLFVFYIIAELKPAERREKSINQRRCSCLGCARGLWSPGRNWGRNRIHTYIGACSYMHRCVCIFIYFFSVCMCIVSRIKQISRSVFGMLSLSLLLQTHTHMNTHAHLHCLYVSVHLSCLQHFVHFLLCILRK